MRISKIDSYVGYMKNYNSYMNYNTQKKSEKDDLSEAIQINIFDESYDYHSLLNNMLYLKKGDMLFKVDMSSCSPTRIATLINYLKNK